MQSFFMWTARTMIRLREWAGWFESSYDAHAGGYIFSRCCHERLKCLCYKNTFGWIEIQSNLVILNSLISNYRLSRSENLVPVLTRNYEQFLLFSTLFYIYISNFRSQITYSFVKCGCSIYCFPHSLNSDMSKYGYLEVFQWVRWNSR